MTSPLLLSFRAAAKLLGVGRGASLHALISAGLLRPVTLLGRAFIPREQIEHLAKGGDSPAPPPRRRTKRPSSIADVVL